jgi:peptidoglycan/LPS O-acetylase OafA/YrhL
MSYGKRVSCLDGLRGIAAIAVMLFHFNVFFLPQARLPHIGRAYLAVDLFFLLSGFVMAHVYGRLLASNWRAHWLQFARARFARIYPLFAVTTLVMAIIFALSHIALIFVSFSAGSLTLQPVLLQQWAAGLSWDYPSWSISTEAEAYIFFVFFAGLLLTGKHPRLMGSCCILAVVALSAIHGGSLNLFTGISALARTLAEFSLGVLLYRLHSGSVGFPRKRAAALLVLLAGLALVTGHDCFMVGALACLILYGAGSTGTASALLNSKPLVALGDWSYGIYLWHAPAHYAIMAIFAAIAYPIGNLDVFSARAVLLMAVIGVVGLSALQHRYFEAPVRRLLMQTLPASLRHGK